MPQCGLQPDNDRIWETLVAYCGQLEAELVAAGVVCHVDDDRKNTPGALA
jgi:hypothetical protein